MIETAIYSLLKNNSSITDLVGTNIYPQVREQADGLPAVTYQIISAPREYDLSGPNGLVTGRVQINCFADTPLAAAELAAVVRGGLNGFSGAAGGVEIESILLDDVGDLPAIEPENERMTTFAKMMDFYILFKE